MKVRLFHIFVIVLCLGVWIIVLGATFFPSLKQVISFSKIAFFISKNWLPISLGLSELIALIPGPWNGILQSVIKILNSLFLKNNINH